VATNFAELHRQVLFDKGNRKIIWQPRIGCWFGDKWFAGEPLPAPFTGMTPVEVYRELNCSNRLYEYNACFQAAEHPSVRFGSRPLNDTDTETVIETPVGSQVQVTRTSANNPGTSHVKWPISGPEEMEIATWRAENLTWRWDQEKFDDIHAEWGDIGAPTIYLPRVNIQHLYIDAMGVANAIYALHDYPEIVEAYFRAHERSVDRLIDVVNASPIDIINFGDNVHAGTLPPDLFRRHCLGVYQKRCEKLHAAGKFVHAHWDGDTKPLLPLARETGMDGIEAVTPIPQGDVTLEEIKAGLGDAMFLLDGIPAVYFDAYYPLSVLEECTRRLIELFAPKLVLGISDEISSTGDLERIRFVGEIVDGYNAGVDKRSESE